MSDFDQERYACRLEWGWQGAEWAAERGDILVVVDTLRFSSTVVTAVANGVLLSPCLEEEDIQKVAERLGAIAGGKHAEGSPFSLSPSSFMGAESGTKVALGSRNGAACSRYAERVPYLLIGTLLNARAVGVAVNSLMATTGRSVTLNPCGERWTSPNRDGTLRVAIEDYLGAGAILAHVEATKSPEAEVCLSAFLGSVSEIERLLLECGSGRELCRRGEREDVLHVAQIDHYSVVPFLKEGWFVPLEKGLE